MKKIIQLSSISFLLLVISFFSAQAQIIRPVKWSFSVEQKENEAVLLLKATIETLWHLYSQNIGEGGPIPTGFKFTPSADYELIGKVTEPEAKTFRDPNFDMDLKFFEKEVVFKQKIKLKTDQPFSVKGTLEFMVCNDQMCLPPTEVESDFKIRGAGK